MNKWDLPAPTDMYAKTVLHPTAFRALKAVHTAIWLSVETCMIYVLYAGVAGRTDRRAATAGAVVMGESLVFLANGARCPLTELGVRLGGERASVTDLYLPKWLAHNLPAIHVPLVIAAVVLHGRNLRRSADGEKTKVLATKARRL
jgi:hypothetical protein